MTQIQKVEMHDDPRDHGHFGEDLDAFHGRLADEFKVPHDVIVVDGIEVGDFNFVDLGQMLQAVEAIPVVVKSLVFEG